MKRTMSQLGVGAVLLLLGGCAAKDRAAQGGSDAAVTAGDPCGLLEVQEVVAAIGPLRDQPYRYNENESRPDPEGGTCVYQAQDFRTMRLEVDWTGGAIGMKMLRNTRTLTDKAMSGKMVTETGDTIAGAWDEVAPMPMNCCILEALLGDQLVTLDWTGTRLSTAASARLLDAAVQRLGHPLSINGAAPIPAVLARLAAEPKDRDPCSLVTREEAEAILGPLTAAPERAEHGNKCSYIFTQNNLRRSLVLEVYWTRGFSSFAGDMHVHGLVSTRAVPQITGGVLPGSDTLPPAPGIAGPWDDAYNAGGTFAAVRKDVMISTDYFGVPLDMTKALVAKAFSKF